VTVAAAPTEPTPGGAGSPGPPTASAEAHLASPQRMTGADACPLCGTPLSPEQDWCLHCGAAARTRLAATPNWKAPIATIAVVAVIALGVLAAALVKLAGGSGSSSAPATTTITTPAASTPVAPAATTPGAATTPAATVPPAAGTPTTTTGSATPTTPGAATTTTGAGGTAPTKPNSLGKAIRKLTPAQREALRKFNLRANGK
jgi:hypothetical protein